MNIGISLYLMITLPLLVIGGNPIGVLYCWICDSSVDSNCLNNIPHGIPDDSTSANIRKYFQPCNWSVNVVNYQCLTIYMDNNDKHIIRQCGYDDYQYSCYKNQTNLICPCDYNGCNGSVKIFSNVKSTTKN
ncbi:hypothetical protein BLA29_004569 [Euroglyphus maynei]|uniref:Protein sleepless n=1 Tax=Euroglyphus maynei TaxID=6958 RepID=A0A1Y3ARG0_EURMA|nr:hypothetical protein BLA29_004569 [Euroglyphus maynei]